MRHILVKTQGARRHSIYAQLKSGRRASRTLAKKYSQDPGSKDKGGKLDRHEGRRRCPSSTRSRSRSRPKTVSRAGAQRAVRLVRDRAARPRSSRPTTPSSRSKAAIRQHARSQHEARTQRDDRPGSTKIDEELLHGRRSSTRPATRRRPTTLRRRRPRRRRPRRPTVALAEALVELQELTERLRRDCPWDREQTARTIVPHTVEEAYEVADAALAGDDAKLLDELGDLLFQVYFLALLLDGARRRATSRRSRAASTRSSSRATRTSSATSRRETAGARARRTGSGSRRAGGPRGHLPRRARVAAGAALRAQGAAARGGGRLRVPGRRRRARRSRGRAARAARRAAAASRRRDEPDRASPPSSATSSSPASTSRAGSNVDPELELRARGAALPRAASRRPSGSPRPTARTGASCRSTSRTATSTGRRRDASEHDRRRARAARSSTRAGTRPSRSTSALESGALGRAVVPSGASTGVHEAVELRDGGAGVRRQGRHAGGRERQRRDRATPCAASTPRDQAGARPAR